MQTKLSTLLLTSLIALGIAALAGAQRPGDMPPPGHRPGGPEHAHGRGGPHDDDATMRHRFDDVEHWVQVFDNPERDAWQRPEALVGALDLDRGDVVADVGAGTGYFSRHLSEAVGPRGTVLSIDVEPSLVEHLRHRAEVEGTANVVPVLGSYDDPRLPAGVVDLVLMVDTYHHVDDRVRYFTDVRRDLARGGRVAIVDFREGDLPVGPPAGHKLSPERVIEEMSAAGFKLQRNLDALLRYQYVLIFSPRRGGR